MKVRLFFTMNWVAALALAAITARAWGDDPPRGKISFSAQVRPIFNAHCIACHGGIKRAADLSFVYRETIVGQNANENRPVVAGDPDASELIARVTAEDEDERMPPKEHGERLTKAEIDVLRQWIAEGAAWETHWAFTPPQSAPRPPVSRTDWCRSQLDFFVLHGLDEKKLRPSTPADPASWLRRVSFDLIGLPPSEAELDAFLADPSDAAREQVVDRLLASPQFGERWATPWLDVARYADTMGYEKDPPREIWPYRDWVIRALNDDMPFDQFTIKQLAGDLLPEETIGDRLATAFHRNTQANTEGGTDDEEFRIAAVIDRANTTAQVWLGLTLGCAQCHDHPYEPITQAEYYQFLAFFNNTRDCDTNEEFPRAAVPLDRNHWAAAAQYDHRISALRQQVFEWVKPWIENDDRWHCATITSATATGTTELNIGEVKGRSEIRTSSLSSGSNYTIECAIPESMKRITAIRLEALPLDEAAAALVPQTGFILSFLKAQLILPDGQPQTIPLQFGFGDDPDPFYSVADSLNPNFEGWSCYPKQSRASRAIFVPSQPVECPPGSKLQLVLEQQSGSEHLFLIRRARFWLCDDEDWTTLRGEPGLEVKQCELTALAAERAKFASMAVPVMVELPENLSRSTRVFHRGSFLDPTSVVAARTPNILPPIVGAEPFSRLDLARWLVSRENPLTARVLVNRVWSEIFGTGLVESVENFGSSGSPASQQDLLDHLALRLAADFGWSLKRMLREIVLSSTYGQSSLATADAWQSDPRNQNLSRGPRNRLTAEMIRDQALAVSGRLSSKMYGPPVMPPQPEGLWQSAYSGESWNTSTGEDRYRRAVYTYCKRTSGYPGLLTFDAPTRDVCVVRRIPTNTPVQALVTLNDVAFFELAQAIGARMSVHKAHSTGEKIAWGYRLTTGQFASNEKLEKLGRLFEESSQSADGAANAWTIVAAAILNLDEAMTR